MKCCICGPVKNCGPYINKVLENVEKIGALFDEYKIILFYDHSKDDTLEKLKKFKEKNKHFGFYMNPRVVSSFRTHNIAFARNYCIRRIREKYSDYPFFIMMDFDDVNCKNVHPEVLRKYLGRQDWDALSFNTTPKYYDIWGLSIYPYSFSYNHFINNNRYYDIIQNYVDDKLKKLPEGGLLSCLSSFNGFSIYRTSKFLDCYYDGKIRMDLIPKRLIDIHSFITQSPIIYKKYITVDGRFEDCEHRAFHMQAVFKNNAKIRISPEILFS